MSRTSVSDRAVRAQQRHHFVDEALPGQERGQQLQRRPVARLGERADQRDRLVGPAVPGEDAG
ncbi:hypothetical protein [Dactylosporangium cerinum]